MLTDLCTLKFSRGRMPTLMPASLVVCCLFADGSLVSERALSLRLVAAELTDTSYKGRSVQYSCLNLLTSFKHFTLTLTDCGVNATKCNPANDFNLDSAT